jgi:hypothetical protein
MSIIGVQGLKDCDYFLNMSMGGRPAEVYSQVEDVQEPNIILDLREHPGIRNCFLQLFMVIAERLFQRLLDLSNNCVNWRLLRRYMNDESFIESTEEVLLAQIEGVKWPEILQTLGIPRSEDTNQAKIKKIFQFYFKPPKTEPSADIIKTPTEVEEIIAELSAEHHPSFKKLEILHCYHDSLE